MRNLRDIFNTFLERRSSNLHDIDSVKEIQPELSLRHQLGKVRVGREDQSERATE